MIELAFCFRPRVVRPRGGLESALCSIWFWAARSLARSHAITVEYSHIGFPPTRIAGGMGSPRDILLAMVPVARWSMRDRPLTSMVMGISSGAAEVVAL